jgi:hypothetical protein
LDLADHIAEQAKDAATLADLTRTHAPSLYRLMRTLASLGILTEDEEHRFALTPLGEALKTGAPGSARSAVLTLAGDLWWRSWGELVHCIKTGETGVQKACGMTGWEWLNDHPQERTWFEETMVGFHGNEPHAVAAVYDFSASRTIVDVGGGIGHLLATILTRYRDARGILLELPDVEGDAIKHITSRGLSERIAFQGGDFFKHVPAGGDSYLLSHVIHDWSDDKCLAILGNCRSAMKSGGRLLIIEMVLPPGDTPHLGKLADMEMLVMSGGQERTENEFAELLHSAGFSLERVIPTDSLSSIIEAFSK